MPTELIKDFLGKDCIITLMSGEKTQMTGRILEIEGYWMKIQEKDSARLINGAIVRDIKIIPNEN